jgi:predicted ATPase/class 3 adenylate cyclase/DNA-binding CsgD family transcriptional regulator
VTLLLGDVEGSTRAWEADPKQTEAAILEVNEIVDELVGRFDGVRPVEQGEGDSFVAAFARARDGVACALEVQRALLGSPLALRLGVHTGDVTRRDEGNYVGPTIIRAARLRNLAHGGQTVLSEATRELVADAVPDGVELRDLGVHRLKDLSRAERVYELCHPDLRDEFPPLRSLDARANNLPVQRTTFIGREREIAELVELLGGGERLVTLTGSGGCGKTRLAVHVGAELIDGFPDGVWVADLSAIDNLAAVADFQAVAAVVLRVFSLKEGPAMTASNTLVAYLGQRHALIVFDNCEHVIDASAQLVDALLSACPEITALATSRQPLGLEGEVVWRVPSLPCPAAEGPVGIAGVSSSEAVQLFADRAQHARPGFVVSERNAEEVAEICRRLDGIPLAIELAAARVRVFSPAQIADGLNERFRLLTGAARTALPRQQTLEASVDWSYHLLTNTERVVFRRLSVFAGGFSFDAAQQVCAGTDVETYQVLDQLSLLVDKSLVVAELEDEERDARYRLLETMRAYAAARLAAAGEDAAVRAAHCVHYLNLVAEAGAQLEGPSQTESAALLDRDYANIRAALEWSHARGNIADVATAAAALALFWASHGPTRDGERWLDEAVAHLDELADPVALEVLFGRAWVANYSWDVPTATGMADQGLVRADEAGDEQMSVRFELLLGSPSVAVGGPADRLEAAVERARATGDDWALAFGLTQLATWWMARDGRRARSFYEEAVRLGRATNQAMANVCLAALAYTWVLDGALRRGADALEQALPMLEEMGDRGAAAGAAAWLTIALVELGEPAQATRVVDRLAVIARESGIRYWTSLVPQSRGLVALGERDYRRAVELGHQALETAFVPLTRLVVLAVLAEAQLGAGMLGEARETVTECLELCRVFDNRYFLVSALLLKAGLDRAEGELGMAETDAHEALTTAQGLGARCRIVDALEMLAAIALDLGSGEEAARLLGGAAAVRGLTGYARDVLGREALAATGRTVLGDNAFESASRQGRSLSVDEAVAYARRGRGERKRPSTGWASLTPTERQVVDLIQQGKTNSEIAKGLFVSPRTVQTHLTRIYAKLGVSGRTELAAQAARRP